MRVKTPSGKFESRPTPSVAAERRAIKAVTAAASEFGPVAKGFLTGNAALMGGGTTPQGGVPVGTRSGAPGTSWSNQGNALIARVNQRLASEFGQTSPELEAALSGQGLSWGPPFPPGRPLDPFWGYKRPPRTWDYAVGENVQLTPRWNRVSFKTLKALYDAYDVAQLCVRHHIDDVRSLDVSWLPPKNCKDDVSADIEEAERFWAYPDRRQPFDCWLAEWLQDVLRYDAGALFIRETEAGEPYSIEIVSGETIIPLIDFFGRRPEESDEDPEGALDEQIVPAFLQIIEGLPWDWLTADQMIYQPLWPLPESQYGQCPLETILLSANTDLRFQWHFLQYFTEGTLPAGFMEAPPDLSDPAQITAWQEDWDALMLGDQAKLNQIRWVPNGSKFQPAKEAAEKFDATFPLALMRRCAAAYKVTPADLGYTEEVNKASSEIQIDVQARVGRGPILKYVAGVVNLITQERLGLRARLVIEDGQEEDRVAVAQAHGVYIDHGVEGVDEVRAELGKPINKERPFPRVFNNTRAGPIPLLAVESQAGEVDPETYGRGEGQALVSTPYASPPGALPAQGSPEQKTAAEHTAQASRDLIEATTGEKPPAAEPEAEPEAEEVGKGLDWRQMLALIDAVEKEYSPQFDGEAVYYEGEKIGYVQMIGPNGDVALSETEGGEATRLIGFQELEPKDGPYIEVSPNVFEQAKKAAATAGVTAATGIQGLDFQDDDDEDEAKKAVEVALELRRWRENTRGRLRKGRAPRRFSSTVLPPELHEQVWQVLKDAKSRGEVDAAFAGLGKPSAGGRPAFHSQADRLVAHYAPQIQGALGKLWSTQQIHDAIDAARPAGLSASEKAAVWDKSAGECSLRELAYRDGLLKAAGPLTAEQIAAITALRAKANTASLSTVLTALNGDSFLQGAHDAAQAASASVVDSLQGITGTIPAGYWDDWKPGYGQAAANAVDGGMREMLDQAGVRIKGIADSATDRIGNLIGEGLARGDSTATVAKAVRAEIENPARAETIANTEYARSMDTASVQTYEESGIAEEDWLAEGDACPECQDNADSSPYKTGEGPSVPAHPVCRCAKAPHEGGGE